MYLPASGQTVTSDALEERDELLYLQQADTPFTGKVVDPGVMDGEVVNGIRIGRWNGWHPNGEQRWITDYTEGSMSFHAMFYPNGGKRFEGTYAAGIPDGTLVSWYLTGVKQSETSMAQGTRHGSYMLWDPQGELLYSATFTNGTLDGAAVWWYANGQQRWATYYKEGKRSGTWTQWSPEGRVLVQSDWKNGEQIARR